MFRPGQRVRYNGWRDSEVNDTQEREESGDLVVGQIYEVRAVNLSGDVELILPGWGAWFVGRSCLTLVDQSDIKAGDWIIYIGSEGATWSDTADGEACGYYKRGGRYRVHDVAYDGPTRGLSVYLHLPGPNGDRRWGMSIKNVRKTSESRRNLPAWF